MFTKECDGPKEAIDFLLEYGAHGVSGCVRVDRGGGVVQRVRKQAGGGETVFDALGRGGMWDKAMVIVDHAQEFPKLPGRGRLWEIPDHFNFLL